MDIEIDKELPVLAEIENKKKQFKIIRDRLIRSQKRYIAFTLIIIGAFLFTALNNIDIIQSAIRASDWVMNAVSSFLLENTPGSGIAFLIFVIGMLLIGFVFCGVCSIICRYWIKKAFAQTKVIDSHLVCFEPIDDFNAKTIINFCKKYPEIDNYRLKVVNLHRPLNNAEFRAMQEWEEAVPVRKHKTEINIIQESKPLYPTST
jgi:hypothetical protein